MLSNANILIAALLGPTLPIVVGFLLTRKTLKQQKVKLQEIHVLVNSRLSKTLNALADALTETVRLKDAAGIAVSEQERGEADALRARPGP